MDVEVCHTSPSILLHSGSAMVSHAGRSMSRGPWSPPVSQLHTRTSHVGVWATGRLHWPGLVPICTEIVIEKAADRRQRWRWRRGCFSNLCSLSLSLSLSLSPSLSLFLSFFSVSLPSSAQCFYMTEISTDMIAFSTHVLSMTMHCRFQSVLGCPQSLRTKERYVNRYIVRNTMLQCCTIVSTCSTYSLKIDQSAIVRLAVGACPSRGSAV